MSVTWSGSRTPDPGVRTPGHEKQGSRIHVRAVPVRRRTMLFTVFRNFSPVLLPAHRKKWCQNGEHNFRKTRFSRFCKNRHFLKNRGPTDRIDPLSMTELTITGVLKHEKSWFYRFFQKHMFFSCGKSREWFSSKKWPFFAKITIFHRFLKSEQLYYQVNFTCFSGFSEISVKTMVFAAWLNKLKFLCFY